jgi:diguanylate cyclase (GGDEF)-like protein/hemerythrin-like metal-binding protein/PAS domain S-box-containing protein
MEYFEIFPWNDNFETGISIVDEQHIELVRILNELAVHVANHSSPIKLDKVFNELTTYADYHFKTEEGVWNAHFKDDDWLTKHEHTHHAFIEKISLMKSEKKNKPLEILVQELLSFLTQWLAFHILDSDKRMAKVVLALESGKNIEQAKIQADQEMSGSMQVLIKTVLSMYDSLSTRTMELMREKNLRKQAEADLLASEERWKVILEGNNDGIWDWDIVNDEIYVSEGIDSILNLAGTDKKGTVSILPDDVVRAKAELQAHLDGKTEMFMNEHRIVNSNGVNSRVLTRGKVVSRDKQGKALRMVGTHTDITEREIASAVFQSGSEAIFVNDIDNNIISVNPAFTKLTGFSKDEMLGDISKWIELIHPQDRAIYEETMEQLIANNIDARYQYRIKTKKDNYIWLESTSQYIKGYLDNTGRVVNFMVDITERKKTEEKLIVLSRAMESSASAMIITDPSGNIEYVNPKFTEITGYSSDEVTGKNPSLLQSGETPRAVYIDMWQKISSGGEWKGELRNQRKDGSHYWDRISISGVKNSAGKIINYISIQEDATFEYELAEKISYQASHDSLTGLINRQEFERRVTRLLSTVEPDKHEHALCFMDLDQFKVVNDTCGHQAGDELLRQLSSLLQNVVRKRDTLGRLGGDEFGVLMEHCSLKNAQRLAESLQKVVHEFQFRWQEHAFKIGVSIGLVSINETVPNMTELMQKADAACYVAKDLGRNRIHVYHDKDENLVKRHGEMLWVERIQKALEKDRFCLYAQPIVPLDNNNNEKHYELLLRMENNKGELFSPSAYLPAAERYDLISQLDNWVIETAFKLLAEHPVFLSQVESIAINLSGHSLSKYETLNFITSQLDKYQIEGSKICFEITETAAISNLSNATRFISKLKKLNCRFSLDDFGSGLSSFGYLKSLPVDYLKIDGMFVKNIVSDSIDHAMVKSINEIGHVMNMKTIAEFVENDEIKGMVREIGIDYGQGFGIGKPLPFIELLDRTSNVIDIKKV